MSAPRRKPLYAFAKRLLDGTASALGLTLLSPLMALIQRFAAQALAGRERFSRLEYIREQVQIYERLYAEKG